MNLVTIKAVMVSRVWLLGLRILDLAEHNLGVWGPTVSRATDFGSGGAQSGSLGVYSFSCLGAYSFLGYGFWI